MIKDSGGNAFEVVIVWKLDRFSRDRYDSMFYKKILKDNYVKVISVLEPIEDTPEGDMLEGIIELMSSYYSRNLAREVEKGRRENALNCKHIGGRPPFGYDVDKATKKLIINEDQAKGVKLIFKMHLKGYGYSPIIEKLRAMHLKTGTGKDFGKNSLFSILTNEKYTGVYIYNKSASKDSRHKRNGHKYKPDEKIIRIPGGVPQIISKEDFDKAQEIIQNRKHKSASYRAKETYLLSGKIICGECGSAYCGNSRVSNGHKYVSYNCTKKNGSIKCHNGCVSRDKIDSLVLDRLADYLFNKNTIPDICKAYQEFLKQKDSVATQTRNRIEKDIKSNKQKIDNLVNVIATSGNNSLVDKLTELEKIQKQLQYDLQDFDTKNSQCKVYDEKYFKDIIKNAKKLFKQGSLANQKALIFKYIDKVIVYKNHIEIKVNLELNEITDAYTKKEQQNKNSAALNTQNCVYDGGEGGIRK